MVKKVYSEIAVNKKGKGTGGLFSGRKERKARSDSS